MKEILSLPQGLKGMAIQNYTGQEVEIEKIDVTDAEGKK